MTKQPLTREDPMSFDVTSRDPSEAMLSFGFGIWKSFVDAYVADLEKGTVVLHEAMHNLREQQDAYFQTMAFWMGYLPRPRQPGEYGHHFERAGIAHWRSKHT